MMTAMTIPAFLCAASCSLAGTPPVVDDYVIDDGTLEGQIVYEDESSSTILRIANRFTVLERREHALIAWVSPVYGESSHFGIEDVRLHLDGDGDGRPDHSTNPIWSYKGVASSGPPFFFIELADGTKGYRIPSQFLGNEGDTFFLEVVLKEFGPVTAPYDVNVPQPIAAPPPVPSYDCSREPDLSGYSWGAAPGEGLGTPVIPTGDACKPGPLIDLNYDTDVAVEPIGFVRFEGEPWTSITEITGHNGVFQLRLEANTIEYALDDGDAEATTVFNCINFCQSQYLEMHQYQVKDRAEVLTQITFAHPAPTGQATVAIYPDPNNDGSPSDLGDPTTALWTSDVTWEDTGELDELLTFDVPNVIAGSPGDSFFVAVNSYTEGIGTVYFHRIDRSGKDSGGAYSSGPILIGDPIVPSDVGLVTLASFVIRVEAAPLCPTDLTRDGTVDNLDLNAVLTALNTQPYPWTGADATGDGLVNSDDLAEVLKTFGAACP